MAQMAKQKSTNEDVKNYADEVIKGHSNAPITRMPRKHSGHN